MKAAILIALVAGAGCVAEDYAPDVGPPLTGRCESTDSSPDTDVSFEHEIRPLFDREGGMGGCSCHTPTNGNPSGISLGGLDLGSYQSMLQGGFHSGTAVIVPGDPCSSLLIDKISSTPGWGARMPLDGPPYLTPEEITLIKDWITEGAMDN
jgi:hypothetical protein